MIEHDVGSIVTHEGDSDVWWCDVWKENLAHDKWYLMHVQYLLHKTYWKNEVQVCLLKNGKGWCMKYDEMRHEIWWWQLKLDGI